MDSRVYEHSRMVNSTERSLETRQIRAAFCALCPRDVAGRHELWFPIVKSKGTGGGIAAVAQADLQSSTLVWATMLIARCCARTRRLR